MEPAPFWLNGTGTVTLTQISTPNVGHTEEPGCFTFEEEQVAEVLGGTVRAEWSSGAEELLLGAWTYGQDGARQTGSSRLEIDVMPTDLYRRFVWGIRYVETAGFGYAIDQEAQLTWNIQYNGTRDVDVSTINC